LRFTSKLLLSFFLMVASYPAIAQVDQIDPTSQIQWNLGVVTTLPNCTQNGQYTTFPYGAQWGQHAIVSSTNVEWTCTPAGWVNTVTGINLSPNMIYNAQKCIGTSGIPAAYSCSNPLGVSIPYGGVIEFFPDVASAAGATLSANSGPSLAIYPPLAASQWTGSGIGYFLQLVQGQSGNPDYWNQVGVSPSADQSTNVCSNSGTTTALVCADSGFTGQQGHLELLNVAVTNGTNPTLNVNSQGAVPLVTSPGVPIPLGYLSIHNNTLINYVNTGSNTYWVVLSVIPVLPITGGGTGCTTAPCALANLGAASLAGANTFGNVQDYTTTTPVFVGGLNAVTSLTGAGYVRVIGRFAYVTADSTAQYTNSNSDNLSVIDIGNPAAPKIVGQVTSTQLKSAEGLECVGSYCYIVAGTPSNNFVVVNIANPAAPVQVAFLNDATHFNDAVGMTISGKYAYMASGNISGTVYLNTIDISNPSAPVLLSSATSADLAGGADEVIVKGNYAYVCTVNGVLSIWNISNPLSLVETAHIGTVGTYAYVQGRYAYTISTTQLYVLDVSNPGVTPTIIGTSSAVASGNLFTIKVAGRYAYVTDFNSTVGSSTAPKALHVFDIGTPTAPTLATTLVDAINLYGADDVFISGGYAYVTLNNISTSGGLTIFRITGINMTGANIGNLNTDDASVNNDLHVGKDLYVQNGVISGPEGVLSQGPLTVTGNFNVISTAPTSSVGAVSTYSTNSDGEVTGLSAATTVTITFANSGWTHAAFCTAVDNQAATPVANTTQTKLAVTFTFSALTGNLFYHCGGN
jgi:hypothetical protein